MNPEVIRSWRVVFAWLAPLGALVSSILAPLAQPLESAIRFIVVALALVGAWAATTRRSTTVVVVSLALVSFFLLASFTWTGLIAPVAGIVLLASLAVAPRGGVRFDSNPRSP